MALQALMKICRTHDSTLLQCCVNVWLRAQRMSVKAANEAACQQSRMLHHKHFDAALSCWAHTSKQSLRKAILVAWKYDAKGSHNLRNYTSRKSKAILNVAEKFCEDSNTVSLHVSFAGWKCELEQNKRDSISQELQRARDHNYTIHNCALLALSLSSTRVLRFHCFSAWNMAVNMGQERRELELKAGHRRSLAASAISGLSSALSGALSKLCWYAWCWVLETATAQRHRELQDKLRQTDLVSRAAAKLCWTHVKAMLQACFGAWSLSLDNAKQDSSKAEQHRSLENHRKKLHGMVASWANSSKQSLRCGCLVAWLKFVRDARSSRQQRLRNCQVALSTISRLAAAAADTFFRAILTAWVQVVRLEKHHGAMQETLRRASNRHQRMCVSALLAQSQAADRSLRSASFSMWCQVLQSEKHMRGYRQLEGMRRSCLAVSAMTSLCQANEVATLNICFVEWLKAAEIYKREAMELAHAAAMSANKIHWEQVLRCCAAASDKTLKSTCLVAWHGYTSDLRRKRDRYSDSRMQRMQIGAKILAAFYSEHSKLILQSFVSTWFKHVQDSKLDATMATRQTLFGRSFHRLETLTAQWRKSTDRNLQGDCIKGWLQCVRAAKASRQEQLKRNTEATKALLRLCEADASTCLHQTWYFWCQTLDASKHETKIYSQALMAFSAASARMLRISCFQAWFFIVRECQLLAAQLADRQQTEETRHKHLHWALLTVSSCQRGSIANMVFQLWHTIVSASRLSAKQERVLLLIAQFKHAFLSRIDECCQLQMSRCFDAWVQEVQDALKRAKQSELAVAALAQFCKDGRDLLLKEQTPQSLSQAVQISNMLPQPHSNPCLVDTALRGCAGMEHVQQLQQQVETLAWRCARDLAEMIGDREARLTSETAATAQTGLELAVVMPSSGNLSLGNAATALAEAYGVETRRLLRVHGRLVEELQPIADETRASVERVLLDTRQLLAILVPAAPSTSRPALDHVSPRNSKDQSGSPRSDLMELSVTLSSKAERSQRGSKNQASPQHEQSFKHSIAEAFRALQSVLPGSARRKETTAEDRETLNCGTRSIPDGEEAETSFDISSLTPIPPPTPPPHISRQVLCSTTNYYVQGLHVP
eukprot:TRINITY_DN57904_c0_g1_i1.p1 TRINITY_DN57904_c0_g1~~TRINITY_DN57904_c0_g1_i1.p1  ORF type:complete len:1280 (-),score=178.21 TRINITY_DN57904_c0_g1_i1:121-3459(-)